MTARHWTPQADDSAPTDYDEAMADMWADDLADRQAQSEWTPLAGDEHCVCGALFTECRCYSDADGEDGYASGGHMEYWHAQYE